MAKTYYVSLMITVDDDVSHPDSWDWSLLLGDNVILEDVQEVEEN